MSSEVIASALESDLRLLSSEARRADGLASQLTGWLSGPEHPQIKEAAERAILRLRSFGAREDSLEHLRNSKDVLRPFVMAIESKSSKLICLSLVSVQKLVAADAIALDGLLIVIQDMEQVERMHDEAVQLKILQTALTLMQSTTLAQNEEGIAMVLGICFRLLANAKNTDSVTNTAAATVRQAVALVFDHVLVEMKQNGSTASTESASPVPSNPGSVKATDTPRGSKSPRGNGTTNAALKLLDDLCMMATASEGMLKWLKAPALPRPFVLDLLDFVLGNSAAVFRSIPAFEHALLVRACQLLTTQLQNLLDPACEPALQQADLKIVLRVVRTVLRHFYRQLKTKCGVFIEALLAGTQPSCSLWQRISVMQVMRQLCADAYFLLFLYTTYDAKENKLFVLHNMVQRFAEIVDKVTAGSSESPQDDDAVNAVATLYHNKAHGKDWTLDNDYGSAPADTAAAYLAMLSIDCLLNTVAALEKLTDVAVDGVAVTPDAASAGGKQEVDKEVALGMCQATWRMVLNAVSQLLARCSSEEIILHLLKGYQSFTQALGILELKEARDAYLSSLCSFALSSKMAEDVDLDLPMSPASTTTTSDTESVSSKPKGSSGKAAPPPAPSDPSEGVVLTPKNVHALRTLFNIAHRLHHLLGPAWVLVLDILNTLDKILQSPRTTTQEISNSSTIGARPSDLAILSTAASQLFESTRDMSTDAVISIMSALREVSAKMIPEAAKQPGQPKLYALVRMVEVILTNLQRINHLWPIFLSHVMELLSHPKGSIRNAAIEALAKAVVGALSHIKSAVNADHSQAELKPPVIEADGEQTDSAIEQTTDVEGMLMLALGKLYKEDRELDVQMGLLRVILQVLQRHGEQLTSAWVSILELLAAVPQAEEADTVQLAFQSVQLLCSDYMSSLPVQHLRRCVEVAALYGSQQADVNVSLTAISLLWNASDLLGKLYTKARSSSRSSLDAEPLSNGNTGSPAAQLDSEQYQELVRLLYGALQGISSTDNRSEVRNCAVRTLFAVVVSQGNRMSSELWDECLWEILFPLLRAVHHMSVTSSREETKGEVLGRLRGVSVKMLMHHSRNSEQKQWDETLVLALSGMGRLLRAHLPLLVPMQAFPQGWEELMLVVESSMAGGRKEVALAAIAVITTVMQAHGTTKAVSRSMWKRAMRAMDVGVEAAASPQCMVPLQARLELVNAIGQLNAAMHEVFEEDDMRQIFRWLTKFLNNPYSEDDQLVPAGTLPPVQKAAFALFPSLVPLQPPELWPELLNTLIQLLKPHLLEGQQQQQLQQQLHLQLLQQQQLGPGQRQGSFNARGPAAPSSNNNSLHRPALSSLSMERALEIVLQLYKDSAPWEARARTFCPLITVLGKCMATRYTAYSENLWRAAAAVFNSIVNCGLPAVNISYTDQGQEPPRAAWQCLAEVFEWFLLGTRVVALDTVATAEAIEAIDDKSADDSWEAAEASSAASASGAAAVLDPGAVTGAVTGTATPSDAVSTSAQTQNASPEANARNQAAASTSTATPTTDDSSKPQLAAAPQSSSETTSTSLNRLSPSQPTASTSKPTSRNPSRHGSRNPSRDPSFSAATGDTEQSSSDAELEASVVDTLTDAVLTSCSHAPEEVRRRLIGVLDQAIVRPKDRHIPNSAAGIRFSHTCLRKLYVLSSRGVQDSGTQTCLLEVAQLSYPVLLARYSTILGVYSQHIQHNSEGKDRLQLDETLCVLEVCCAMKIAPAVADAVTQSASQQQVVQLCRQLSNREVERSHLLLLYGALSNCINSKEHRVRELVKDTLQLAGNELGLIANDRSTDASECLVR